MKKLQALYPEARIEKKRAETDTLASNYVQSLYNLLPTLDLTNDRQKAVAQTILDLAKHVSMAQKDICGEVTAPLQGGVSEVETVATLTDEQHSHLASLIQTYDIYAAEDPETHEMYISHPLLTPETRNVKNKVELYSVALEIDRQWSAQKEQEREQVL